jgi:hypothetical protein
MDLAGYAHRWVDMVPHLEQLTEYAKDCELIVEFGVRGGVSTWAMLNGLPAGGRLLGVDPDPDVAAQMPPWIFNDERFRWWLGDDRTAPLPAKADMVMIDSSHLYEHTVEELRLAAAMKPKRILCHDYLFGGWCEGLTQAIDEADADPEFPYRLAQVHESAWGLAVLEPR